MELALQMYVGENSQNYPYSVYGVSGSAGYAVWWQTALETCYPLKWTNAAYHCPAFKAPIGSGDDFYYGELFGSYAYNWGSGTNADLNLGLGSAYPSPPLPESRIRVPSEMLALGDARLMPYRTFTARSNILIGCDWLFCGGLNHPDDLGSIFPARHGENYNVAFCDGHVAPMAAKFLFNPTNSASLWNNDHQPHPETWW
jgi:prepilin-type processing-associated H-X9-DG protein